MVADVFEHLDADDPIKGVFKLQRVHVRPVRPDVGESQCPGLLGDVGLLAFRIRHGQKLGTGEPCRGEQCERAPAAAKVQDPHAILDAGARQCEFQHRRLGLGECADAFAPVAGTVLETRPERQPEECRGYLVVLFVGGVGGQCDGRVAEFLEQFPVARRRVRVLLPQPSTNQVAYAETKDGIRQASRLGQFDGEVHDARHTRPR